MFSQASVSHSVHRGGDGYVQGCPGCGYVQGVGMYNGWARLLLTPSGGHHTCSRQAAGMHPTGMLSCLFIIVIITK